MQAGGWREQESVCLCTGCSMCSLHCGLCSSPSRPNHVVDSGARNSGTWMYWCASWAECLLASLSVEAALEVPHIPKKIHCDELRFPQCCSTIPQPLNMRIRFPRSLTKQIQE